MRHKILSLAAGLLVASAPALAQDVFLSSVARPGATRLAVASDKVEFTPAPDSVALAVDANLAYSVTSSAAWCKAAMAGDSLVITVDTNAGSSTRKATVTLAAKDNQTKTVAVSQKGQKDYPHFIVISDVHFDNGWGRGAVSKVSQTLQRLYAKDRNISAVFVCGDLTDAGRADQYTLLKQVFNNYTYLPRTVRRVYMMGNHDRWSGADAEKNYAALGQPLHQYIELKGYPFITISYSGESPQYNTAAITFLSNSLRDAAAKYPGKPIFVFTHAPVLNTCYGSSARGADELKNTLKRYPQVVMFSGHNHTPVGDPRSISQVDYTAVNDGSVTYCKMVPGEVDEGISPPHNENVTEGLVVSADMYNKVTIRRFDTNANEEILPAWKLEPPYKRTNFAYKGRDGGAAPAFAAADSVSVPDITTGMCGVSWPQATDDEVVHRYRVELRDSTGSVVAIQTHSSLFYLNSKTPKTLSCQFKDLGSGSRYRVEVKAIDSYGNESAAITSREFTTVERHVVALPVADVLDVEFSASAGATDVSPMANTLTAGSVPPTFSSNAELGRTVATFPGNGQCFYKLNYKNNATIKNILSDGFTIEVLYKPNSVTAQQNALSAMDHGGVGIMQAANGGQMQFRCSLDGSYVTISSGVNAKAGEWMHAVATYSKADQKMWLYVNGEPAGMADAPGALSLPGNTAMHWFGIGGDPESGNSTQVPLDGDLAVARLYGKAVTADEAWSLYNSYFPAK